MKHWSMVSLQFYVVEYGKRDAVVVVIEGKGEDGTWHSWKPRQEGKREEKSSERKEEKSCQ